MTPHTHAVAPGAAAARHLVWKIIIARTLKTGLLKRYQDPRAQNEGRRGQCHICAEHRRRCATFAPTFECFSRLCICLTVVNGADATGSHNEAFQMNWPRGLRRFIITWACVCSTITLIILTNMRNSTEKSSHDPYDRSYKVL